MGILPKPYDCPINGDIFVTKSGEYLAYKISPANDYVEVWVLEPKSENSLQTFCDKIESYIISKKGKKRLKEYNKRWLNGYPVMLRIRGKGKTSKKFKLTTEYRERASAIRGRIVKQYDLYAYLLPLRNKSMMGLGLKSI